MNEKELIDWFWNKYNYCYPVIHSDYPDSIFLFYDEQFIRKMKLCLLSGKPIEYPKKIKGICLFELDWKYKYFYYDYDEIYSFLKSNLNDNYQVICNFIGSRLKEVVLSAPVKSSIWASIMHKSIYTETVTIGSAT